MTLPRTLWIQGLALIALSGPTPAADLKPNAVRYRGTVYLSLGTVAELLGGEAGFGSPDSPLGLQPLRVAAGGKEWRFPNGGDRIARPPDGRETRLRHPLLVVDGEGFIALGDGAEAFGFRVVRAPDLVVALADRTIPVVARSVDSAFQTHEVRGFAATHEAVEATGPLTAVRSLYKPGDVRVLPRGTTLLARRKVVLAGTPHLVVTDARGDLASYLVAEADLRRRTTAGTLDGTRWAQNMAWFADRADRGEGLRHGDRGTIGPGVCLTVDLCWSLRRPEGALFDAVRDSAQVTGRAVHPVLFVSGRWLDQHPVDMEALVRLDFDPGVRVSWGIHSWVHPKSGRFLNDFTPAELRDDTLRVERALLEWGIVPSVFYRFPGLIHDTVRFREILTLDLFPIDCDSWMALVDRKAEGPFATPVGEGSILLVHGNGNEPEGIPPLLRWLKAHRDWGLRPLDQFLPAGR